MTNIDTYKELVGMIENHHFDPVKHWLENGGDPELGVDTGETALILQVIYELFEEGDQQDVLDLLQLFLECGASADPASVDKPGELLWEALQSGSLEAVRLLIEYNVDCNIIYDTDYPRETPLIYAVEKNDTELVQLILLRTSPDLLHVVGGYKVASALGIAFGNCNETIVRLLLEAGADPHFKEWDYGYSFSKDLLPLDCAPEKRKRIALLLETYSKP